MSNTQFKAVTPAQKMLVAVDAYNREFDRLERENAALLKDKQRLDFLESVTGSLWVSLHLGERKWLGELERLTRKEIDRRMATEVKP